MDAYLKNAFGREELCRQLEDSNSEFFLLLADGKPAGYIKLNEAASQTDIHDKNSLEIERIYVSSEFQGCGLGSALMNLALETASERKKGYVWLGVWENNKKALEFYGKNGFRKIGEHLFVMGDDAQTDYIMRRDITGSSGK